MALATARPRQDAAAGAPTAPAMAGIEAILDRIFSGPLARLRGAVTVEPLSDAVPASKILRPALMAEFFARRVAETPGSDLRAVASVWTKEYVLLLLPPLMGVRLLGGPSLSADPGALAIRLEGTRPAKLRLAGPCDGDFYGELLAGHLRMLVEAAAEAGRLSPRVIWSNAGNLINGIFHRLEGLPAVEAEEARVLMDRAPGWFPDGNPLYEPVRTIHLEGPGLPDHIHRRRVCCLRYLSEGVPLCGTCPKIPLEEQIARAGEAHRAREVERAASSPA